MTGGARKWLVTFGGAGLSPLAPGTIGSLAAAFLIYLLSLAKLDWIHLNLIVAAALIASSAACVGLGAWAIDHFGRRDPGAMVLDEVAGVCLTMLFQPAAIGARMILTVAAAFVAFRIFDILKPPPCRHL